MSWRRAGKAIFPIATILVFLILGTLVLSIESLLNDNYSKASTIIAIGSGSSTILLVILTGWYSSLTRELVIQAEKDRQFQENLRKKDQTEAWYGDVLYRLRMIQTRWDRGLASPDGVDDEGGVYLRIDSSQGVWKDLDSHFESLPSILSQRPGDVNEQVVNQINQIYIQWVHLSDLDIGGEREDPRVFESDSPFADVESLEEKITQVSNRH